MFNILGTRKIWYGISGTFIVLSIAAMAVFGFKLGIDFTGGTLLQVHYTGQRPDITTVTTALKKLNIGEVVVQPSGDNSFIVKSQFISNDQRQAVLTALGKDVVEDSFEAVGPTVGADLSQKALQAVGLVVLCIVLYIAWAFRGVSKGPVPSWAYGLSALIALMHDIIIPVGIFVVLGKFFDVQLDTLFITALLTILGFSVHDTIVVFDRIRENLKRSSETTFAGVINESINHTMTRSLNTSVTVLLVLAVLFVFGGSSIHYFILALMVGILVGTYSSVFIASPLLLVWQNLLQRNPRLRAKPAAPKTRKHKAVV